MILVPNLPRQSSGNKDTVMKKIFFTFAAIFIVFSVFGQVKKKEQEVDIIDHQVKLGESVRLLSKKYLVDPTEIYKLNKFAVDGISEGMTLKIPVPRKEVLIASEVVVVEGKKSAEDDLKKQESIADEALKIQTPTSNPIKEAKQIIITEEKKEVIHKVLPKETLYSLSRDFNVSVDDIKANNPELLTAGLKIGQLVKIRTNKTVDIKKSSEIVKNIPTKTPTKTFSQVKEQSGGQIIRHTVEPKETLYSLSKKYGITVDEIKQQNSSLLINGLQIGQVLELKAKN
jgi:LysM repeat protein